MAQPDLIPMPFAESATHGTIEPIPATTPTVPQGATWSTGFPQVTMQPLASGGFPPRGQDFNGVLKALSQHIFHMQSGGQYKWDDAHGPYSIGDVLQSDDGLSLYVSSIDNNTVNFNTTPSAIGNQWIPAGGASKANSSLTINAGAGLGGGGDLAQNRTLFVDFASAEQAQELLIPNKVISPLNLGQAFQGANQSLAVSGYQKLPGGLIIQWGAQTSVSTTNDIVVTLPIAFPNQAFLALATAQDTGSRFVAVLDSGLTTVSFRKWNFQGERATGAFYWVSIGY